MSAHAVERAYQAIQKSQSGDIKNPQIGKLLADLFGECAKFLGGFARVRLKSKVPEKEYFAFEGKDKISRPVNQALYVGEVSGWNDLLGRIAKRDFKRADALKITEAIYTVAISFCAAIDLLKKGDQKTPGTFFISGTPKNRSGSFEREVASICGSPRVCCAERQQRDLPR
jgi:hypothetical protein